MIGHSYISSEIMWNLTYPSSHNPGHPFCRIILLQQQCGERLEENTQMEKGAVVVLWEFSEFTKNNLIPGNSGPLLAGEATRLLFDAASLLQIHNSGGIGKIPVHNRNGYPCHRITKEWSPLNLPKRFFGAQSYLLSEMVARRKLHGGDSGCL